MLKQKKARKFNRKIGQRKALLKTLATSLVLKEKIKITQAKAKDLSSFVEKIITRAKKGDVFSRRKLSEFFAPKTVKKLVDEIGPKYKDRKGGYTRIIKLGPRKSDGTKMAIIEFVK